MHLACVLPSLSPRAQPTARGSPMQPRAGPPPTGAAGPSGACGGAAHGPHRLFSSETSHSLSVLFPTSYTGKLCFCALRWRKGGRGLHVYPRGPGGGPGARLAWVRITALAPFAVGPWTGYSPSWCLIFLSYINEDNRTNTTYRQIKPKN